MTVGHELILPEAGSLGKGLLCLICGMEERSAMCDLWNEGALTFGWVCHFGRNLIPATSSLLLAVHKWPHHFVKLWSHLKIGCRVLHNHSCQACDTRWLWIMISEEPWCWECYLVGLRATSPCNHCTGRDTVGKIATPSGPLHRQVERQGAWWQPAHQCQENKWMDLSPFNLLKKYLSSIHFCAWTQRPHFIKISPGGKNLFLLKHFTFISENKNITVSQEWKEVDVWHRDTRAHCFLVGIFGIFHIITFFYKPLNIFVWTSTLTEKNNAPQGTPERSTHLWERGEMKGRGHLCLLFQEEPGKSPGRGLCHQVDEFTIGTVSWSLPLKQVLDGLEALCA